MVTRRVEMHDVRMTRCRDARFEQQTRWRQLRRRDKKKAEKKNSTGRAEGRQDGFSNPLPSTSTRVVQPQMSHIVDGANAVNSFVMVLKDT